MLAHRGIESEHFIEGLLMIPAISQLTVPLAGLDCKHDIAGNYSVLCVCSCLGFLDIQCCHCLVWLLDSVVVCTLPQGNILLVYFLHKNPSCVNDVAFIALISCRTCDDHDVRNQSLSL